MVLGWRMNTVPQSWPGSEITSQKIDQLLRHKARKLVFPTFFYCFDKENGPCVRQREPSAGIYFWHARQSSKSSTNSRCQFRSHRGIRAKQTLLFLEAKISEELSSCPLCASSGEPWMCFHTKFESDFFSCRLTSAP